MPSAPPPPDTAPPAPPEQHEPEPGQPYAEELALARACAAGDAQAQEEFDRRYAERMAQAARRVDASPHFAQEVRQAVRERLLLSTGGAPPRIAEYSGRGPLGSWVYATALRTALNLRRGTTPTESLDERLATGLTLPSPDPELALIKVQYRESFRTAFQEALRSLEDREVHVLRLHFAAGLNIDEIGRSYGVHRATVARWIARSRERLLTHIRHTLTERLRLEPAELDSLLELVRSQIDLSLSQGLAP